MVGSVASQLAEIAGTVRNTASVFGSVSIPRAIGYAMAFVEPWRL